MSFASAEMALGYARSRPPVHSRILELVWGRRRPFRHVLDLGCGAGVSTAALAGLAEQRTGVDPVEAMCRLAPSVAPAAHFCAGAAEYLPFSAGEFDCITAAGSLNYSDIDRAFPEMARVLEPGGLLMVYDFSTGRSFDSGPDLLDAWFDAFLSEFPRPVGDALVLNPDVLAELSAKAGFRAEGCLEFAIPVEMTAGSYLEYVLTETNVAGKPEGRPWCLKTLRPVWKGREAAAVVFRGYAASFRSGASRSR